MQSISEDVRLETMLRPFYVLWFNGYAVLIQDKDNQHIITRDPDAIIKSLKDRHLLRDRIFYIEQDQKGINEIVHNGENFISFASGHKGYRASYDRGTIYMEVENAV